MSKLFCYCVLVAFPFVVAAQSEIQGNINCQLELENSPYSVVGDILVEEDQELYIEAGVELIFTGNFELKVEGRITAIGKADLPIWFTSSEGSAPGSWKGIILDGDGGSRLTYCNIQLAEVGINAVSTVTMEGCVIEQCHSDGVIFSGSSSKISRSLIRNNGGNGILCSEFASNANRSASPKIYDNLITGNAENGLLMTATGTSPFTWEAFSSHVALMKFEVFDNMVTHNALAGIECMAGGRKTQGQFSSHNAIGEIDGKLMGNVFAYNTVGVKSGTREQDSNLNFSDLTLVRNSVVDNQEVGVQVFKDAVVDLNSSIVWQSAQAIVTEEGGSLAAEFCAIEGGLGGEGNIDADPLFIDLENGNFDLQEDSPCVDTGAPGLSVDQDGTPPNMGQYLYAHPLSSSLSPKIIGDNFFRLHINLSPEFYWQNLPGATHYQVQLGLDDTFSERLLEEETTDLSTKFRDLEPGRTYFARVRGLNEIDSTNWRTLEFSTKPEHEYLFNACQFEGHNRRGVAVAIQLPYAFVGVGPHSVQPGFVLVFKKESEIWQQHDFIQLSDQATENFGRRMQLVGDYLAIAAPGDREQAVRGGAVYIMKRIEEDWVLETKLQPEVGVPNLSFGDIMSFDGRFLVVGTPSSDEFGNDAGAVYVYENTTEGWQFLTQLQGEEEDALFGRAVAVDNGTILVGASKKTTTASNGFTMVRAGAVYVYKWIQDEWVYTELLTSDQPIVGQNFGKTIGLKDTVAVIGASDIIIDGTRKSSAYIFEEGLEQSWQQKQILSVPGLEGAFAEAYDFTGNYLAAGVPNEGRVGRTSTDGVVYLYEKTEAGWYPTRRLNSSYDLGGNFGAAIDIDENYIIVGKPKDNGSALILDLEKYESGQPILDYPEDGTRPYVLLPELNWEEAEDPIGYRLQLATDSLFNEVVFEDWNIEQERVETSILDTASDYFWRVKSGSSDWSETWSFRTKTEDTTNEIFAPDPGSQDKFGYSLALGYEYAIIGAPENHVLDVPFGAAYLAVPNGDRWRIKSRILPEGEDGFDLFGTSVAIQDQHVFIGDPSAGGTANAYIGDGAVFCYDIIDDSLVLYQKLIAEVTDGFGHDIAVDSNYLLVADNNGTSGAFTRHKAFLFKREGESWVQKVELEGNTGDKRFADEVAMSSGFCALTSSEGILIYTITADSLILFQTIENIDQDLSVLDRFSIAMNDEFLFVGLPFYDASPDLLSAGRVQVYRFNGTDWTFLQNINPLSFSKFEEFGNHISVHKNNVLISTSKQNDNYVTLHQFVNNQWQEVERFVIDEDLNTGFGTSTAIIGNKIMIGAPRTEGQMFPHYDDFNVGSVFHFETMFITSSSEELTTKSILKQNSPNPFRDETVIEYILPAGERVQLTVFDIYGRTHYEASQRLEAGRHQTTLSGLNLESGMYFYRLKVGNSFFTKKMLVID